MDLYKALDIMGKIKRENLTELEVLAIAEGMEAILNIKGIQRIVK